MCANIIYMINFYYFKHQTHIRRFISVLRIIFLHLHDKLNKNNVSNVFDVTTVISFKFNMFYEIYSINL